METLVLERSESYVKMYVASGRQVVEVARTAEQLLTVVAMMSIANDDGIETPLVEFAKQVAIDEQLEDIDEVSLETGDDPKGFFKLRSFQTMTPQSSVDDMSKYDGEFPSVEGKGFENACSFELVNRVPDSSVPSWMLDIEGRQESFYAKLSEKKFDAAWLLLNSTGWAIEDAKSAIQKLVSVSSDRDLAVVAEAWCSVADVSSGSY